jgi:hypothetical protein
MLPRSYNGWPASSVPSEIGARSFSVMGVEFPSGVRGGDVAIVMRYVLRQVHLRVEKLRPGWCWGGYYRVNRNNPDVLSNHASFTACDVNAPAHPNGVKGTWSEKQRAEIKKILAEVDNVVACGEFYRTTTDGMHFEINAAPAEVHRAAQKIRDKKRTPVPVLVKSLRTPRARALAHDGKVQVSKIRIGRTNPDVLEVQRVLNRWYPFLDLVEDGQYGPSTHRGLVRAREAHRLSGAVSTPRVRARLLKKLGFKLI